MDQKYVVKRKLNGDAMIIGGIISFFIGFIIVVKYVNYKYFNFFAMFGLTIIHMSFIILIAFSFGYIFANLEVKNED